MTAHDASRPMRLAGTLAISALLLVGCREGAPGTSETVEPTGTATTGAATETETPAMPAELTEERLSQALLDTMGEDTEILTGDAVLAQQVLRQQWGDIDTAEPEECLATLVGTDETEESEETPQPDDAAATEPADDADEDAASATPTDDAASDPEETPGPLEEVGAELAASGTTVDASQPGSFLLEQLTVMTFASTEEATAYILEQRDAAVRCSTVDVTLGNGTELRADTEVNELSHHTDEALEVLNAIAPAADEDDAEAEGGAQLPAMEISTVLVREGDQVFTYLSSEQPDVGVGLTFIDQLSEAMRAEES